MCSRLGPLSRTRHRDTPSHRRALRKRWHPKRGGTPPSPGCPHPSLPGRQAYHILDELLIAGELQATSRHHALAPASATSALVLFSISVRPRPHHHAPPPPSPPPPPPLPPSPPPSPLLRAGAVQEGHLASDGRAGRADGGLGGLQGFRLKVRDLTPAAPSAAVLWGGWDRRACCGAGQAGTFPLPRSGAARPVCARRCLSPPVT